MIWPRSRTKTPSAARNQLTPAVNRICGISSTGSHSIERRQRVPQRQQEAAVTAACAKNSRHQSGDHQVDRQRLHREHQLLDEIAMLQHHAGRAADGFAEGQPGQHAGQEVEREAGAAGVAGRSASRSTTPNTKKYVSISSSGLRMVQKRAAEGAAIAPQDVAPHHGADQAAIAPDGRDRVDEGAADGAQRALAAERGAWWPRARGPRARRRPRWTASTSRNGQPCS